MEQLVVTRSTCRLCGSENIMLSVPLASVPIVSPNVGAAGDEEVTRVVAPLDNYLCGDCGLIQLIHVVDPSLIYRNYLYRTSVSLGLPEHFKKLADSVLTRQALAGDDLVVEIGSNDGTLLSYFWDQGLRVQGIDPARTIAEEATARGVPTRADFFDERLAMSLAEELGRARAILCNNAIANIDDLGTVLRGVHSLLAPDGAFVFETQYALDVFQKTLVDVIYHEHISCFSVKPISIALKSFGLEVFDAERIATKGGSIRFWVKRMGGPQPVNENVSALIALEEEEGLYDPARHGRFAEKVQAITADLHRLISETRDAGGAVAAYGTSVGSAALIHQFALEDKLDYLFDDKPFKERLEGPGYDLPVHKGDRVAELHPGLIIVLAWRYLEPIVAKHKVYLDGGGRFVTPLPEVRAVSESPSH